MKRKKGALLAFGGLVAALALVAAGCGGGDGGNKTLKIVSDLPLQGSDLVQTGEMEKMIAYVIEQAGNKAGDYTIEYESFDDATPAAAKWDEAKCTENARTYADTDNLVGVMGTYNSGCAALIIPVINEVPIAMISAANTGVYLTHTGVSTGPGEPEKYYPTGKRNYTRVVASDDYQGKADVAYMKNEMGVTKLFILDDKEGYGKGIADEVEGAAKAAGLTVVGRAGWDKASPNYNALMAKVQATGADGVFMGGVSANHGGQLIKDKVAVLGDNTKVKLLVPDGFVLDSIFKEAGAANMEGVYGTAPVLPVESLPNIGQQFVKDFMKKYNLTTVQVYSVYAAASAQVLLDAISRSDGTQADVVAKMFETDMNTVAGPIKFDANGDPFGGVEQLYKADTAKQHWTWVKVLKSDVNP
jgi:branched-chain amino acid transport system substrate-binding protein